MQEWKDFNLFKEFEAILKPEELNLFILFLDKIYNRLTRISLGLKIIFAIGVVSIVLIGKILPYYSILVLHGIFDFIALGLTFLLLGLPIIYFFIFSSLIGRLKNFLFILHEYKTSVSADEYYVIFNCWGQIEQKIKYHVGGIISGKKEKFRVTTLIEYRNSSDSKYDILAHKQVYTQRYYARVFFFRSEKKTNIDEIVSSKNGRELLSKDSSRQNEIEIENNFRHLSKKERNEKIRNEIQSGLSVVLQKG